ncbi:hypothetical protein [Polyangium sorediatum]|uniref:Serine/threonine protein kinase n=1 Tax=Polyangium sorediatum TaxID=889274 RepID=A0ABT6P8K5_9BACT|nr:hypothetical protein [Polyangium sorediatum]MDI1436652.1 hypothetical protein [Polyangium sorediatum]
MQRDTTPDEETQPEAEGSAKPLFAPSPLRRRLLSLLLLAGGGAAFLSLAPHWPKEHTVDFRLDGEIGTVVGFDVTWSRAGAEAGAVSGSSFRFEPGRAPKIVHTTVHLPDGSYALDIRIDRADRSDSIQRTLTLGDAEKITVPLR